VVERSSVPDTSNHSAPACGMDPPPLVRTSSSQPAAPGLPAATVTTAGTVEPCSYKLMEAFAVRFLMVSFRKIGKPRRSILWATAVGRQCYLHLLPAGSPRAARTAYAWDENLGGNTRLPRTAPVNFVEIIPRLD